MRKRCFIDVETTGLDPVKNGIVQISGMIDVEGKPQKYFDYSCKPMAGDEIEEAALKVHGIRDFSNLEHPLDVYTSLKVLLSNYVNQYDKQDKFTFIAYNAKFDYDFMRAWFNKCGDKYFGSFFWFPPVCVMIMAMWYLEDKRSMLNNFKLMTVAKFMGITVDESKLHDSLYDIKITREVYDRLTNMIKKGKEVS